MRFGVKLIVIATVLFSCNNIDEQEIQLKLNKGKYKIISRGKGIEAKDGQYLIYSLFFTDEQGKIFLDRRNSENLMREQVKKDSFSMNNLSPVSEMIYALSKGDSAILKVPLTNEEKINELRNSDTLKFFVKVIDIMDEEKVLKYLSNNFKDETQQNQRYVPEYDEIRRLLFKKLKDLKGIRRKKETYFTPYGIEYFVLQSGSGEKIGKGSRVSFDYIGLKNPGFQEFDNSYFKTQDVEIVVGEKKEITAWDDALSVMNKDMVAVFFIPSEKAYGKAGKPGVVQPDTDLIYLMKVNKIIK